MKKNNYEKGLKLIKAAGLVVKKLKTFNGHEGVGANAEIHHKRKKVADFIDEGNGGEPYVYFYEDGKYEKSNAVIEDLAKSLPAFSLAEQYEKDDFDWDSKKTPWTAMDVMNALVDSACERLDFKKALRKILGVKDGQIFTWKHKKSDLDRTFRHGGKAMKLRDIIEEEGIKILNLLPEDEAFAILRQHS